MNTKFFVSFLVLGLGVAVSAVIVSTAVFAQTQTNTASAANIQYPVQELGGCTSEQNCKTYCDDSANINACVSFAEKNNLMSQEDIVMAKKFATAGAKGPGGCTSKDSCDAFCNDAANIDECVSFAEQNGMMPPEQLKEAKQVQAAIKRGVKPPACGGKKACDSYCQSADHMEECMNFALAAGFMNEQEAQDAQKALVAIKQGVKPPACQGKEACDAYCGSDAHFEECTNFALAAGFMSAKDAEMAKKTGGKGPGGCKGKDQCDAFCNDQANQETCFQFGVDNGMIPQEDLQRMKDGKQQMQQMLTQAPATVLDCLNSSVGSDALQKLQSGAGMPPRDVGDKMKTCFEKMIPLGMTGAPGEGGNMPPGVGVPGQGPNGNPPCTTPEECKKMFGENGMQPGGQQGFGPNGNPPCTTPEECQKMFGDGQGPNGQQGPDGQQGMGMEFSGQQQGGNPQCSSPEECAKLFGGGKIPEIMMGKEQIPGNFQQGPTGQQLQQFKNMMPQSFNEGSSDDTGPGIGAGSVSCGTGPGTCSGQGPDDINSNKDNGGSGFQQQGVQGDAGMGMGPGSFQQQPGFQQSAGQQQMQQQIQQQMQQQVQQAQQQMQQFIQPPSGGSFAPGTAPASGPGMAPASTPGSEPVAPTSPSGEPTPPPSSANPQNLFGQLQKAFSDLMIR
ncbi:MAG: hypothetical protein Q7R98_00875 [Candidatus Jorgensenbacteria bacterium]|nr:hypothetical protein [Candidatus Jorgensenbacteria bacterium]